MFYFCRFFDGEATAGDATARLSVLPKPGRLLLFDSTVPHVGRAPSRLFWGQRLTIAIKFVPVVHV